MMLLVLRCTLAKRLGEYYFSRSFISRQEQWTIPTQIPNGKRCNNNRKRKACRRRPSRNDILRAKGILPPKEEQSKEAIEDMYVEALNARKQEQESLENKTLDELDELEDELEDDRVIMEYRYVCAKEESCQTYSQKT